ncbi:MAG: hypothetical protein ACQETL_04250 [Bacteroidota bacterium]
MKFNLFLYLLVFFTYFGKGQNLNMVIEVNHRLVESDVVGAYLNFETTDGTKSRNLIGYYPGELMLDQEDWEEINSELTKKITLSFNYYDHSRRNDTSLNIEVEMQKEYFDMRYLILRVYDLREKAFKKRYGCLTENDFVTEFSCPDCGVLIQCK